MKDKVFVSAAHGMQGGAIARQLMDQGAKVTTISSSAIEGYTDESGLEVFAGSLAQKSAIAGAMKDASKAVYTYPLIFDQEKATKYTQNFIDAAQEANVDLVVFNATFDVPQKETGHFGVDFKRGIQAQFKASNLNVITLMPDIYIDNLAAPWSIPLILEQGVLPYPVGSGVQIPWISHTDLGKFTASALNQPALAGQTLPIGGNLATGEELAAAISSKINKPVQFVSVTPDDFEQQLKPNFGPVAAKEISNIYRYVEQNKTALAGKSFAKTQEVLNIKPQSVADWVDSVNWAL